MEGTGLYRGGWALDPDRSYVLSYNVDQPVGGPGTLDRPVEAIERTRILLELERGDPLIERIEHGREVHVRLSGAAAPNEAMRYGLDRAAEALAATRECTHRHAQGT